MSGGATRGLAEVPNQGELDAEEALDAVDHRRTLLTVDKERLSLPVSTDDETDRVAGAGS